MRNAVDSFQNLRLRDELRFQQEMTSELKEDKRKAEERCRALMMDIQLLQEKEKEYARQVEMRGDE